MMPKFPIIELFDRYAIARVKFRRTNANQEELMFYQLQLEHFDIASVKDELLELESIHNEIWELEKELKSGHEDQLPLEEIGRRAIAIRDHNNKRVRLKNRIAEILNCTVREIKKDHLSQ